MAKKILVIDDEQGIRDTLSLRLKANQFEVITAENGKGGLSVLEKQKPDLIILDILMPVMDGFDFFKTIRKDPRCAKIPVLVLTARGQMRDTFEAFDVDAFIAKPFDSDQLMHTVENLLTRRVLVLCDDHYASEDIKKALQRIELQPCFVNSIDDFFTRGREEKFQGAVIHLAVCSLSPDEFLVRAKRMKNRAMRFVIYSDATVKGTEDNYTVAINEIRETWKRAGLRQFYDARLIGDKFNKVMADWLL